MAYDDLVRSYPIDARAVLRRGISYAFVLAALIFIFIGIEFTIEKFVTPNDEIVDIFAAAVGAFFFSHIRSFFETMTDRTFFRGQYDYATAVGDLGELLSATIDLKMLVASLEAFLMRTIKPDTISFVGISPGETYDELARLFTAPPHDPFFLQEYSGRNIREGLPLVAKELGAQAIIPLVAKGEMTAIMILGKKLSGDIFRAKDVELLRVISHQAGMAIENARLYEEVRRHNEELEARVKDRTEKIIGMQEAQSRFLTDVSHELQTPVAILKGNMEILERKRKGNSKVALRVMEATLDRMSRMVDQLLAIARLNFSKDKLYKKKIGVENLLESVYNDCLALAEDKGITLSYASARAFVSGDRDKLKTVILNLISNALKHTDRGGKISMMGSVAGENVVIVVADTGAGIDPENLKRIFERFYRISTDTASGNGIGLDICEKLIEAHDGTITAESEVGKGSRFIVSLPSARPSPK